METLSTLAQMRPSIILNLNQLVDAMQIHEPQQMFLMLLVLHTPSPLESIPNQSLGRIKHGDENIDSFVYSRSRNLGLGTLLHPHRRYCGAQF